MHNVASNPQAILCQRGRGECEPTQRSQRESERFRVGTDHRGSPEGGILRLGTAKGQRLAPASSAALCVPHVAGYNGAPFNSSDTSRVRVNRDASRQERGTSQEAWHFIRGA